MAYAISDECVACGACAEECPVSAISEGDGKFVIDPDTCISCGACAGVCPVGAPAEAETPAVIRGVPKSPLRRAFSFVRTAGRSRMNSNQ